MALFAMSMAVYALASAVRLLLLVSTEMHICSPGVRWQQASCPKRLSSKDQSDQILI
jgi:hypothetical protein